MIRLSGYESSPIYLFNQIDPIVAVYLHFEEDEEPVTAVATTTNTYFVLETPEQVISTLNNLPIPLTN